MLCSELILSGGVGNQVLGSMELELDCAFQSLGDLPKGQSQGRARESAFLTSSGGKLMPWVQDHTCAAGLQASAARAGLCIAINLETFTYDAGLPTPRARRAAWALKVFSGDSDAQRRFKTCCPSPALLQRHRASESPGGPANTQNLGPRIGHRFYSRVLRAGPENVHS